MLLELNTAILGFAGLALAARTCHARPAGRPTSTIADAGSAPATSATATGTTGAWYKPKVGTSFLWSLDDAIPENPKSSSGLELSGTILGVDLFGTSKEQIKAYKDAGHYVSCYFSAGTFEGIDARPDAASFNSECYCNAQDSCKMDDWDEWWLNLGTPECMDNAKQVAAARLKEAYDRGCSLVEGDNIDADSNETGWQISASQQLEYIQFLAKTAHDLGLGYVLKNAAGKIKDNLALVETCDAVLIESCLKFNECEAYKPFIDAKKPAWNNEYKRSISCDLPGMQMTAYDSKTVDIKAITDVCYTPVAE